MCSYKTLKNNQHGYVIHCNDCNHIQVAFGTFVLSVTIEEFDGMVRSATDMHTRYRRHPGNDRKIIHMPTIAKSIVMVFTISELRTFLNLIIEGHRKLQYNQLFVFNEN